MRWFIDAIIAISVGLVFTLVVIVGSLIALMFTAGVDAGRVLGLFGALYFQSHKAADGTINANMGVASYPAILGIFVVLTALSFGVVLVFRNLVRYRKSLIASNTQL